MIDLNSKDNSKISPLVAGFALSILCTLVAYWFAMTQFIKGRLLFELIAALGLLQIAVQITFFFRLGKEKRPRWNLIMFVLMVLVVFFIIAGSVWIMNNLNYYNMGHEPID